MSEVWVTWRLKEKKVQRCPLDTLKNVRTESYQFESCNQPSNSQQKQSGEAQRSWERKWRRHALLSFILSGAALSRLPLQKLIALKQNIDTPGCSRGAAPWSARQDYTWTGQLPGVCVWMYVFDVWPLFLAGDPCSNSCRRERGGARVRFCCDRHSSERFTPHLFRKIRPDNQSVQWYF